MITTSSQRPCVRIGCAAVAQRTIRLVLLVAVGLQTLLVGWTPGSAAARAAEPTAARELASESTDVDLGLFAQVVSSDPARAEGARSGRLEEFPAEDVFLTTRLAPQPDGTYTIPDDPKTGRVIGLEWAERRVLRQLVLEPVAPRAGAIAPVLEYWSSAGREDSWGSIGQTPWQGRWEPLPVSVEFFGNQ